MNIVMATSDLYSKPALITINTLLMNNRSASHISIYYVENNISLGNKKKLMDLVSSYGREIMFIAMPKNYTAVKGIVRTNAIVYSYCFFQDILPDNVDKVLLIESDCIVVDNITDLYSQDITDYYLAAVDDMQSKWYKRRLGISETSPYFNTGVMLINLKKWRDDGITNSIGKLIREGKSKLCYEVQDELNVLLEGSVKIMPPKYNSTTSIFLFDYKDMLRYRKPSTFCNQSDFDQGRSNPVIVHFTKNQIIQSRPWIADCTHPFNEYYLHVKRKMKLQDENLWTTDRGWLNKFIYFFYSKVSKSFVATVLGIVHAFLYPNFLYKFILR